MWNYGPFGKHALLNRPQNLYEYTVAQLITYRCYLNIQKDNNKVQLCLNIRSEMYFLRNGLDMVAQTVKNQPVIQELFSC